MAGEESNVVFYETPELSFTTIIAESFQSEFEKSLREEWTLPPKRAQENARLLPVIQ